MAKVLIDDPMFKKGAYKGQQSDGLYMEQHLIDLVDIYTRQIVNDMQFTGIFCSSTSGVRVGKSTLAQQLGYYYTSEINRKHGLNIKFDKNNIVFRSEDLIKKAHTLPKYSCIILDEGDDLTEHYLSTKTKELQTFLRKSGFLNLFIIFIIPNLYDLSKTIAIHRTNFLIDVKFADEFDRGYFSFYNARDKQLLYIKGKKFNDYSSHHPTIPHGRFVNTYTIPRNVYDKMKLDDITKRDKEEKVTHIPTETVRKIESQIFVKAYKYLKEHHRMTIKILAKAFGRTERTGQRYVAQAKVEKVALSDVENEEIPNDSTKAANDMNKSMDLDDVQDGGVAGSEVINNPPSPPPNNSSNDLNRGFTWSNDENK